jgi:hypothetical protein
VFIVDTGRSNFFLEVPERPVGWTAVSLAATIRAGAPEKYGRDASTADLTTAVLAGRRFRKCPLIATNRGGTLFNIASRDRNSLCAPELLVSAG